MCISSGKNVKLDKTIFLFVWRVWPFHPGEKRKMAKPYFWDVRGHFIIYPREKVKITKQHVLFVVCVWALLSGGRAIEASSNLRSSQ